MSIKRIMGFDSWPLNRSWSQAQVDAEGLDLSLYISYSGLTTVERDGRTWANFQPVYVGGYGNPAWRYGIFIANSPMRALLGNPAVATKMVIGLRVFLTADGKSHFSTCSDAPIIWIGNIPACGNVLKSLTEGEHYLEFDVDFVTKKVSTYVSGSLFNVIDIASMTLDSELDFGPSSYGPQYLPGVNALYFTDFYMTYDNQDGSVSGRLGPVKVLDMPVEEKNIPVSWKIEDEPATSYPLNGGGTWLANMLIPRLAGIAEVKNQFKITSVPDLIGSVWSNLFNISGNAGYWNGTTGPAAITITTSFAFPKRVSGYAFQAYNSGNGAFDNWTFEGSSDGVSWTILDTRTGLGAGINASASGVHAFKVPANKIGLYKHYRVNVSRVVASSNSRVYLYHFQLLGDPADLGVNYMDEVFTRFENTALTDMDYPVLRAATDDSEASFGFKVPALINGDVLAVKLSGMARKEQGASEVIQTAVKVGALQTAPLITTLKSHVEQMRHFAFMPVKSDGTAWTMQNLEDLRFLIKSKRGDN